MLCTERGRSPVSFFRQLLFRFARFMSVRNGPDQLGMAMLIFSFLIQLVMALTGFYWMIYLSYGLYGLFLFRFFSKNRYKRQEENRKFMFFFQDAVLKTKQFFRRLKGMKQYKYFRCPQCRTLLRLSRGTGEKEIHCPRCSHEFHKRA